MRGVDHDPLRFAALARQFGENLVEHAQATPANEPIVDRLVRAIVGRSVAPTQPVLDHEHDRADDPPIVHPRDPMRERKIPLNPTHLNPRQQKQISHGEASQPLPMNQPIRTPARTLIGPEPRWKGGRGRLYAAAAAPRDTRQLAKLSPAKPSSIMAHVEASGTAGPVEGKVALQKPAVGKPAKAIPALSALN